MTLISQFTYMLRWTKHCYNSSSVLIYLPYPYPTRPLWYWDAWKGAGKCELHTLSVDWSTESSLPCNRGIITNTVPTRYFWTTAKASYGEENVAQKFAVLLGHHTLLRFVFECAMCTFFFFLGFISKLMPGQEFFVKPTQVLLLLCWSWSFRSFSTFSTSGVFLKS